VTMGIIMIAVGLGYYLPQKMPGRALAGRITGMVRQLLGQTNGVERAALMGLLTTLLPCGFLYAYVLVALATGHPLAGMATMGAFWLGTSPALLGVGVASNLFVGRIPARLNKLTPLLLMILGLLAIAGKWTTLAGGGEGSFCLTGH